MGRTLVDPAVRGDSLYKAVLGIVSSGYSVIVSTETWLWSYFVFGAVSELGDRAPHLSGSTVADAAFLSV